MLFILTRENEMWHRLSSADWQWPLDYCGHFFVEALIWTQSNSDLEEYAGKDVRQEELLSALSAFEGFFGAWEIKHGKPPTAPSNLHSREQEDAFQGSSSAVSGKIRGMSVSMGTASTCLGFQTGVRDFRRE